VRGYPEPIAKLPRDRLQKIHGIGPNLASKLAILLDTGELPLFTELRQKFPQSLLELKSVPGLGTNRIKILAERLNIRSREDPKHAIEAGTLEPNYASAARFASNCSVRVLAVLTCVSRLRTADGVRFS
jgi:DNA polymerase (family 10)